MKKILFCLFLSSLLFSCKEKELQRVEHSEFFYGTMINFAIYGDNEREAREIIKKAVEEMKRIDQAYNSKNENSILSSLNKNPLAKHEITEELYYLLKSSEEISDFLGGYFDFTIYPLMNLWGFDNLDLERIPTNEEIKEVLKLVDYKSIEYNKEFIKLKKEGQGIDTGAFLKGYAIKRAKDIFLKEGIEHGFVSAISSVESIGRRADGNRWRIGIQNPKNPSDIINVALLEGEAMGVSGDYQTYVETQGQRYHHIINPKTGYPADTISMLVVIAKDSFEADLYSTALFMLEPNKIIDLVDRIEDVDVLVVDRENNMYISKNMNNYLEKNLEYKN